MGTSGSTLQWYSVLLGPATCGLDQCRRFEKGVREPTRLLLIKGTWDERGLVRREVETSVA